MSKKVYTVESNWGDRLVTGSDFDNTREVLDHPETFRCFQYPDHKLLICVSYNQTLREHGSSTDITKLVFCDIYGIRQYPNRVYLEH